MSSAQWALDPEQLHLVKLFAVAHEPLQTDDVLAYLQRSVVFALRPLPSRKQVRDQLESLVKQQKLAALDTAMTRFRIQSAAQHALLALLEAQGELATLAAEVQRFTPLRVGYPPYVPRMARDLLLALYLEPHPDVEALLDRVHGTYRTPQLSHGTLLDALGFAPPERLLRKLPRTLAEGFLDTFFRELSTQLRPVPDGTYEFVRKERDTLPATVLAHASFVLAQQDLYEPASSVLEGRSEPEIDAARAFLALCRRDHDEARELATLALEQSRDKRGALRGVRGMLGPWMVLLLLTAQLPAQRALATQQLARAERDPHLRGLEQEYAPLRALLLFLEGGHVYLPSHSFGYAEWQACLLTALLARFVGEAASATQRNDLAAVALVAEQRGVPWVMRAARSLLPSARDEEGLALLYKREEAWERALSALDRAMLDLSLETERAPKPAREERLSFVLSPGVEGGFALSPRVQTRKGKGFSAGRAVTWKKLLDTPRDGSLFDDHDLRVLPHIELDKSARFGAAAYVATPETALALVGHPRVYAADDEREPVEVVRGSVRIEVEEQGGMLSVSLAPALCAQPQHPVVVERDGPARIIVYALDEAQRRVAQRLGPDGLRVPAAGRARVEEMLGKLVAHFPVASSIEVDASRLPEVPPDPRLYVQLWRRGAGLAARIVVTPLGAGPSFAPGAGNKSVLGTRAGEHGPEQVRTTRDLEAESARLESLFQRAPTLSAAERRGRELFVEDPLQCLEVLAELRALAGELVIAWPEGAPLTIAAEADVKSLNLRLTSGGDWLKAEGELVIDETLRVPLALLLEQTEKAQGRFIALDEQRFIALSETLKRRLEALRALSEKRGEATELHPLAALELASWTHELGHFDGDARVDTRLTRLREANALTPTVPRELDAELRSYQIDGFVWLARLAHWGGGACLADDMGLGKTLQTLALLLHEAPKGPSLVVAPLSVCSNWLSEAARFAPSLRVVSLRAGERTLPPEELGPYDLVVASYGMMQQEIDALAKLRFRVLVLDEAQAIKNAGTLRTKAAFRLQGEVRVTLTGTPVENHLGELWSIMSFLNPGLLGSAKGFEERFVKPIQRDQDRRASALLHRLVRPFVLRRRKNDVLDDLPEKTVITQRIPPSPEERALYETLRESALKKLTARDKPAETRMRLLAELMRLRRAACHPELVAKGSGLESSKLKVFDSLFDELREGGHRALVFSQFVDYLTLVRGRFDARGIAYQYLDGSSSAAQRERAVKAFQRGEGDAFLISLKAGGFGLNLTAADYVFHLDPWWNPAVEDQATDRAHRIGQTRPVTIYRLVMEGSIEEKILSLHAHKRDLADKLLEGAAEASGVDLDTLLSLLRDRDV